MTNHVYKALIPEFDDSMAKRFGRTNNDYSRWQNVQCNRTGHLWQARFYSCPVEFASLAEVLAYIELNPVRAGLVKRPEDWKWSSAKAHLTGIDETGLLDMTWWREHFTPESWADFLQQKMHDDRLLHKIRTATQTGKPLASESGIREIEQYLGQAFAAFQTKALIPYLWDYPGYELFVLNPQSDTMGTLVTVPPCPPCPQRI
jgi:putative transposase